MSFNKINIISNKKFVKHRFAIFWTGLKMTLSRRFRGILS